MARPVYHVSICITTCLLLSREAGGHGPPNDSSLQRNLKSKANDASARFHRREANDIDRAIESTYAAFGSPQAAFWNTSVAAGASRPASGNPYMASENPHAALTPSRTPRVDTLDGLLHDPVSSLRSGTARRMTSEGSTMYNGGSDAFVAISSGAGPGGASWRSRWASSGTPSRQLTENYSEHYRTLASSVHALAVHPQVSHLTFLRPLTNPAPWCAFTTSF